MVSDVNPYATPQSEAIESKPPRGSRAISITSTVGTLAFFAFTILLLRSSPGDQKIGIAFLANGCLMLGLAISVLRSTRAGVFFGAAATIVQIAIMVTLLFMNGTDKNAVILISVTIILPLVLITFWSWRSGRRQMS
ncbi:MAG: hypothetical protein RIK87_05275 [Fuerstiella sp.]